MRKMTVALSIAASLLVAQSGTARPDENGQSKVLGNGSDTCAAWTANHTAKNALAASEDSWVLGFVTAANRWAWGPEDVASNPNDNAVVGAMNRICADHPSYPVAEAAEVLIVSMGLNGGIPPRP
jgi:hypothetical protein